MITKLHWPKKITKTIIITIYCWVCNTNSYNMYNNDTTKRGKYK